MSLSQLVLDRINQCPSDRLDLSDLCIESNDIQELAEALRGIRVHILFMMKNNLGDAGAATLGEALKNSGIHALLLAQNNIGGAGAAALVRSLKDTNCQILDIGGNNIGDTGAAALGEALKGTRFHSLALWGCKIGDVGAAALGAALKNTNVRSLDLRNNHKSTAAAWVSALKGTLVTEVCGYYSSPELSATLEENRIRSEKATIMALGQTGIKRGFPPGVTEHISTFLPEASGRNQESAFKVIDDVYNLSFLKQKKHEEAALLIQQAWKKHRLFRRGHPEACPAPVSQISPVGMTSSR